MSIQTVDGPQSTSLTWTGVVRHLHLTSRAFLPMCSMPEITLTEGRGVEGDRYSLALRPILFAQTRSWTAGHAVRD